MQNGAKDSTILICDSIGKVRNIQNKIATKIFHGNELPSKCAEVSCDGFVGFRVRDCENRTNGSLSNQARRIPQRRARDNRAAFTMIELVFSIVIVGLVILSIPLIVRQSNINTIMSQNVIGYYNALTLIETIKSKPWDRSNVADFNASGVYYILNTGNAGTDCKISDVKNAQGEQIAQNIYTKKGLSLANKRRMCDPNQSKVASFITANTALESINDFQNYSIKVQNEGNDIFSLKTEVAYRDIGGDGSLTNPYTIKNPRGTRDDIKEVKIKLERIDPDGGSEEIAVFTYYATNIGSDIPMIKDNIIVQP